MHSKFLAIVSTLEAGLEKLRTCPPLVFGELPVRMAGSGVYLFTEGDTHLYVGRSNRLRKRYFLHCRPGSQQNQASFAYKLAREFLGIEGAAYKKGEWSRVGLAAKPAFMNAFGAAKARIRRMQYRFVEEPDQTRQALLEAYCTIALDTPYNDFDTH